MRKVTPMCLTSVSLYFKSIFKSTTTSPTKQMSSIFSRTFKSLSCKSSRCSFFFFFNNTAPTKISPLPLHDALPIFAPQGQRCRGERARAQRHIARRFVCLPETGGVPKQRFGVCEEVVPQRHSLRALHMRVARHERSEEHTSELQSQSNLVCRLLLEK